MAVDQATKDYITTHFEDFTAKELADKFKVSKSTVTRIIKGARDDAAKMKADKKEGDGAGEEEKKDGGEAHPNDDFQWSPDVEERETIQLETDDGLHKLLKSAPQNDLDEEADTHGKELTMAAEEEKTEEPDKGQVHQVMEQLTEPDDEEINSLLTGLLGPGDHVPQPKSQAKPKPARSAKKAPTRAVAVHASDSPAMAAVPSSALVAQIRLYVQHFGPQLVSVCGEPGSAEQERWLKGITMKTPHDELVGHMCALRGVLVIRNGINMSRSSVMRGCGYAESTAPYVGMNLGGLTEELANKKDELELISTQMVIDSYDFYPEKMSPKHQLFMLVSSTAFACHNRNAQLAMQQAQQAVPEGVAEKFQTL
jgi:hypothetical protein